MNRTFSLLALLLPLAVAAAPTAPTAPMSSSRSLGLSSSADSQVESPLLQAQSLYGQRRWVAAADAYEKACSTLPKIDKVPCRHWSVLALSQTGEPEDFWKAGARLDTLLSMTEPENSEFAELLLTRSRFHLLQGNVSLAIRTWKMAAASASVALSVPLYQLCEDLVKADSASSLQGECGKIKPKDSSLLKADRVVTMPNPAFRSSSSAYALSSSSSELASSSSAAPLVQPVAAQTKPAVSKESAKELSSGFVLQLGAFGSQENAKTQVENLAKQKVKCRIIEKAGKKRTLYLVQSYPFSTRAEAQEYGAQVLKPLKLDFSVLAFP